MTSTFGWQWSEKLAPGTQVMFTLPGFVGRFWTACEGSHACFFDDTDNVGPETAFAQPYGGAIRLPLAVRFTVSDAERYATWVLDRPSWVLAESTGFWHVQPLPTRPGYVRVWFCVAVRLRARVPGFVVGLVSRLGLRKACFWVRAALGDGQDGDEPTAELATSEDA